MLMIIYKIDLSLSENLDRFLYNFLLHVAFKLNVLRNEKSRINLSIPLCATTSQLSLHSAPSIVVFLQSGGEASFFFTITLHVQQYERGDFRLINHMSSFRVQRERSVER